MNVIYTSFDEKSAARTYHHHHDSADDGGDDPMSEPVACDCTIQLPQQLELNGCVGIGLLDIHGVIHPRLKNYDQQHYYVCCDFVSDSYLQLNDGTVEKYPILRRISFSKKQRVSIGDDVRTPDGVAVSQICEQFDRLVYIPISRSSIDSFRLYLIDGNGKIPSFQRFHLKCALVPSTC